jgi:hypothetical protein
MLHPYFKPVVDMYRKLENRQGFDSGSLEYDTSQVLLSKYIFHS